MYGSGSYIVSYAIFHPHYRRHSRAFECCCDAYSYFLKCCDKGKPRVRFYFHASICPAVGWDKFLDFRRNYDERPDPVSEGSEEA